MPDMSQLAKQLLAEELRSCRVKITNELMFKLLDPCPSCGHRHTVPFSRGKPHDNLTDFRVLGYTYYNCPRTRERIKILDQHGE